MAAPHRRRCLPAVVACLLVTAAVAGTAAAAPSAVQLVLDCSIGTWRTLGDDTPGLVAIRVAMTELAAETADRGKVRIGVRLMGARQPFTAPEACQDTELVLPPSPPSALPPAALLDDVTPRGRRPLLAAVVAAAGDLGEASSPGRRVVLVTAGSDDCGGDRAAAAAALRNGVELRVVGLGLPPGAVTAFQTVAPTHNATSTAELAAALRWAVLDEDEGRARAEITVHVAGDGVVPAGARATLRSQVTRQDDPMAAVDDGFHARVPPGQYSLVVTDPEGQRLAERDGLTLEAGAHRDETVGIGGAPAATLSVDGGPWTAGGTVEAHFAGAPAGRHWVEVVPEAAPAASWTARVAAEGATGTVTLPLPPEPPALEVRLLHRLDNGLLEPLAAAPLEAQAPEGELEVAASTPPGSDLSVAWKGPTQPGDQVAIAAPGAPPFDHLTAAPVTSSDPVTLTAPATKGAYEVRYLNGVSGQVLAHTELEVAPVPITLQVPTQVGVGREFAVKADPEPPSGSLLLLAHPDAAPQEYLLWRSAAATVSMVAPRRPGTYEVRCLDASGDDILARATLEVVPVPVRLEAPARVAAGTRFRVRWTGPDGPEDFIDVAPADAPRHRHLDWAYTAQGNPADLAAPFEPGAYEVRYISGEDLEVLARRALKVQ